MRFRPLLPLSLVLLLAFAVSGPFAGAQSATKPAPGCAGLAATDPANDSTSAENLEVINLFFLHVGTKTTANITLKNLTTSVPSGGTGANWYVVWEDAAGVFNYVDASVDFTGAIEYSYGTYAAGLGYSSAGATTGKFHEGANGVIEIVIPPETGVARGKTLKGPYTNATVARSIPGVGGLVSTADSAPDEGGGKSFTATPCEGAPVPTPTATPAPGGPSPNPGTGSAQQSTLPVTVLTKSVAVKKAKKGIAVKVKSTEPVTNLAGRLLKGTKQVAVGKLAKLNGTATLKLKAKKPLKKGSYTIQLIGKTAKGQQPSKSFKLKIK